MFQQHLAVGSGFVLTRVALWDLFDTVASQPHQSILVSGYCQAIEDMSFCKDRCAGPWILSFSGHMNSGIAQSKEWPVPHANTQSLSRVCISFWISVAMPDMFLKFHHEYATGRPMLAAWTSESFPLRLKMSGRKEIHSSLAAN